MRKGTSVVLSHFNCWILFLKDFFEWTIFKAVFELLQHYFCSMFCFVLFCFDHKVYGILAPDQGVKPAPTALEGKILTTGARGKSLNCFFFNQHTLKLALVFCFAFFCCCCC